MSDPGVLPITSTRLRDLTVAYCAAVRPTVILVAGLSVAWAAFVKSDNFEIVAIAASLAGGVGFLRSMDKKTDKVQGGP